MLVAMSAASTLRMQICQHFTDVMLNMFTIKTQFNLFSLLTFYYLMISHCSNVVQGVGQILILT